MKCLFCRYMHCQIMYTRSATILTTATLQIRMSNTMMTTTVSMEKNITYEEKAKGEDKHSSRVHRDTNTNTHQYQYQQLDASNVYIPI